MTFREPKESDKTEIKDWIAADPDHSGKGMTSDFFFRAGSLSMAIGEPVGLYVRLDPEPPESVRLHIQFGPNQKKSGMTLVKAWPEFLEHVRKAGMKRMIFESVSPQLIGFCKRCFGFQHREGNDYELLLV